VKRKKNYGQRGGVKGKKGVGGTEGHINGSEGPSRTVKNAGQNSVRKKVEKERRSGGKRSVLTGLTKKHSGGQRDTSKKSNGTAATRQKQGNLGGEGKGEKLNSEKRSLQPSVRRITAAPLQVKKTRVPPPPGGKKDPNRGGRPIKREFKGRGCTAVIIRHHASRQTCSCRKKK